MLYDTLWQNLQLETLHTSEYLYDFYVGEDKIFSNLLLENLHTSEYL